MKTLTRRLALFVLLVPLQLHAAEFEETAAAINAKMRQYHYDPAELDLPRYRRIEATVSELGLSAKTSDEFVSGFRDIWADGPFSHVTLSVARQSAAEMADFFDSMNVGGGGARLSWRGDVAILTVNTMMGLDTIAEIEAAYAKIAETGAKGLIVDLRENTGGAFAVRPLVSHLLTAPVDAGVFVSQKWNTSREHEPKASDLESVDPWTGWSVKSFWKDVQTNPITRVTFVPAAPAYPGPVYVLTSHKTASASELAIDAMRTANRVTVVGETSAGEMLSQTVFDIPGGFILSLPIADYYSMSSGRIEGVGISPDIETDAQQALEIALEELEK